MALLLRPLPVATHEFRIIPVFITFVRGSNVSAVENNAKAAMSIALRVPLSEMFEDLFDGDDEDGTVSGIISGNLVSQIAQQAAGLKLR